MENKSMNRKWRIVMKEKPTMKADVNVRELPDQTVAYVRHIGPYKGDSQLFDRLFTQLFSWAGPRGLLRFPETKIMAVYYDNPDLTDEDKLRLDVCITVPEDADVDGKVGKMVLPGGQYAVGRFELATHEYPEAWAAIAVGWLPESGYQPDDRPAFELYLNDPKEHPEGKCIVEIHLPVKPL
jgi:AraC family transcriptional regulator